MPDTIEIRGASAVLLDATEWHIPPREVLVEGPRGSGKTSARLRQIIGFCRRWPGSRHLLCRKTRESMTDSTLVTMDRLLAGHPESGRVDRKNRHNYELFGSEVVCMGLDNPKTYGTEWDTVTMDEAIESSLDEWESLGAVMRHGKMPFQQRVALTNPGHPGHWLNVRAHPCPDALRDITGKADYLRLDAFNAGPQGRMRRLISVIQDNPAYWDLDAWQYTKFGESYVLGELAQLTGHRRARFFQGHWVSAQGTVFPEFMVGGPDSNVIEPFPIPSDWGWYVGWDPGYDHPTAIIWIAVSPMGDYYVADEIYEGGKSVAQHVETIQRKLAGRTVRRWFGDPHEFFSTRAQGKSCAMQARDAGLGSAFMPWANQNKIAMVNQHRELLLNVGRGDHPALYVFRNCASTIMEYQTWAYKRKADGTMPDGDDAFVDSNNHALDVLVGMTCTQQLKYVGFEPSGRAGADQLHRLAAPQNPFPRIRA